MNRKILVMAAALTLSLGAVAETVQAQQQSRGPAAQPTGPNSPGTNTGGAVWDPTGTGGCTPNSPVGGTGQPCGPVAFRFDYLPSEKNCLEPLPVGPTSLQNFCRRSYSGFSSACTGSGGTIEQASGRRSCLVPAGQRAQFEQRTGQANIGPALPVQPQGNPRPGASPPRN